MKMLGGSVNLVGISDALLESKSQRLLVATLIYDSPQEQGPLGAGAPRSRLIPLCLLYPHDSGQSKPQPYHISQVSTPEKLRKQLYFQM